MNKNAVRSPQQMEDDRIEFIAWALWREEAQQGTPASVYEARTIDSFRSNLNPSDMERWLRKGRAVSLALEEYDE